MKKFIACLLSTIFLFQSIPINAMEIIDIYESTENEIVAQDDIDKYFEIAENTYLEILEVSEKLESNRKSSNLKIDKRNADEDEEIFEGEGTEGLPYLIQNIDDLKMLRDLSVKDEDFTNSFFKQTMNIEMEEEDWISIGTESNPFSGNYDGNSFSINNLKTSSSDNHAGLFSYLENANVKNIKLNSVNILAGSLSGSLAGFVENSNISNCEVNGKVSIYGNNSGGIIGGASNSFLDNLQFSGEVVVTGGRTIGGVVGQLANSNLEYSRYKGEINAIGNTGGIAGQNSSSTILNCKTSGEINVGTDTAGGITGTNFNANINGANNYSKVMDLSQYLGHLFGDIFRKMSLRESAIPIALNPKTA